MSNLRMMTGSHFIPAEDHDQKNPKKKKDSHAILGEDDETLIILHGSCVFVSQLIHNCTRLSNNKINHGFINPKTLLNDAHTAAGNVPGRCTACVITLQDRCLHAANIGDNGFILIRDEQILYESPIQQHTYKNPYQLGNTNTNTVNDPVEEIALTEVEAGDIVLAGSAGLFSNLFTHEIRDTVIREIRKFTPPDMVAAEVAKQASLRAMDDTRFTPCSKAAWKDGKRHRGGKISDITVIFAFIRP